MRRHLAPLLAGTGIFFLLLAGGLSMFGRGELTALANAAGASTPQAAPASVSPVPAAAPAALPSDDVSAATVSSAASATAVATPALASSDPAAVFAGAVRPKASPPVRLTVDSIRLDTKVVPTTVVSGVWQVANFAAGYMEGTGLPGQAGNMAISGHDDIQGEVFRHLKSIHVGDAATVYTAGGQYRYVVDSVRYVRPDETSVIDPTSDPRMTLITCWPD
ncbi:MAG: sortase, partial [Chloroflexota bacterium]|nr:sortase [Chloroflexota bacterium]